MSLVKFLIILGTGTILSWTAWVLVITMFDPFTGGPVAHFLFYLSFILALFGTITIIGFFLRYWLEKETVLFRQIGISLRQGLLLSSGATLALLLQSRRLASPWTLLAIMALIVVVELYFLAGETRRPIRS